MPFDSVQPRDGVDEFGGVLGIATEPSEDFPAFELGEDSLTDRPPPCMFSVVSLLPTGQIPSLVRRPDSLRSQTLETLVGEAVQPGLAEGGHDLPPSGGGDVMCGGAQGRRDPDEVSSEIGDGLDVHSKVPVLSRPVALLRQDAVSGDDGSVEEDGMDSSAPGFPQFMAEVGHLGGEEGYRLADSAPGGGAGDGSRGG